MRATRGSRGISEVFSAILMITIAASVGLAIYLAVLNTLSSREASTLATLSEEKAKAVEGLVVVRAYIDSGTGYLWLYVATGYAGASILGVYVDGAPAQPVGFQLPVTLPSSTLTIVGPFQSPTTEPGVHEVRLSTDYGEELGYAEVR